MKNNLLVESLVTEEKDNFGNVYNEMQWNDYKELIKGMTFFDPYIHMDSLTTIDYQKMTEAGVVAIIEPSFRLEQSLTGLAAFKGSNGGLGRWDRFRSSQFGIRHYCTVGLNSKDANNEKLAEHVMSVLPLYLRKEGVVGVGDIGFEDQTKAEEKYFRLQLELAKKNKMPIQIRTPHRDKKNATQRSIDICNEHGIDSFMVIIDHNTEETIKSVIDKGFWASFTAGPSTKTGNEKIVELIQQYGSEKIMLNSNHPGISDSMAVPKTAALMKMNGISDKDIKKVTYQNAIDAFSQSGQIYLGDFQKTKAVDQNIKSKENGVLKPKKEQQNARESVLIK
ncbi:MAG: TatD family hydrolase [Bacteroidota bacterium]|nr:TatD family hydrolase [Bacteroidota bacterium]